VGGSLAYFFFFNQNEDVENTSDLIGEYAADSLLDSIPPVFTKLDSITIMYDKCKEDSMSTQLKIDSLESEILFKDNLITDNIDEYKRLLDEVETLKNKSISIKVLAKTYESMKPEEMKPILSNVDDGTVIAIYQSMSNRSKKSIFKALNPKRAAKITEILAGVKKEEGIEIESR
jgi:flagellar motility protein MotE (MotC chaperone)